MSCAKLSFLLAINWDYMLMILILAIPQLVLWAAAEQRLIAIGSRVILSSILLSMWYLLINKVTCHTVLGCSVSYILDKIFHWIIFTGLLYLFLWTMPDWLKKYACKMPSPLKSQKE